MDKRVIFLFLLFFIFGCIELNKINNESIPDLNIKKTDICFFGETNDGMTAIAKTLPNASIKWFSPNIFNPDEIDNCKIILLKDDGEGRYASRLLRQKIRSNIMSGSLFILYKRAGTLVQNDTSVLGWSLIFGDIIPVEISPTAKMETFQDRIVNGTFVVTNNDVAMQGIQMMEVNRWDTTQIAVKEGKQIAIIREGENQSSPATVAIVTANYGLGKTYYFAYDPMLTPGVLANIFYSVYTK